jgi:hypothetical protein
MSRTPAFVVAACLIACPPALAQEDAEQPVPQVVVSSMKDAYRTAYGNIQKALGAQHDNPQLAPQARVRWMLYAKDGRPLVQPPPIAIAGSNGQIAVVPDGDGGFELPATVTGLGTDVELRIGVRRGEMRLVPLVETGGIDASSRRLGDLRLECEMTWRLEYEEIPMLARAAIKLIGSPCRSKNFGMPVPVRRRLASASIAREGRATELKLTRRGMAFFAPLHDDGLDNDTPVMLAYRRDDP